MLEIIDAGFDKALRLSTFAEAGGLSLSYFNPAFKQSDHLNGSTRTRTDR